MGWLFTEGQSRADLIHRLTEPWSNDGTDAHCLHHTCVGNVLWTVWEHRHADGSAKRYIGCDLMRTQRSYGWGYKDMAESMHPYYYSCPLKYLELVPPASEAWREGVREYHAKRSAVRAKARSLSVGKTVSLAHCKVPEVTIVSLRPLVGIYNGNRYRIPVKFLT